MKKVRFVRFEGIWDRFFYWSGIRLLWVFVRTSKPDSFDFLNLFSIRLFRVWKPYPNVLLVIVRKKIRWWATIIFRQNIWISFNTKTKLEVVFVSMIDTVVLLGFKVHNLLVKSLIFFIKIIVQSSIDISFSLTFTLTVKDAKPEGLGKLWNN